MRKEGLQVFDLKKKKVVKTIANTEGTSGVTLIPEMAVEVETRLASVSIARLAAPRPSRTIGMVWRKSNPLADRFTQIAQIVSEIGQSPTPTLRG